MTVSSGHTFPGENDCHLQEAELLANRPFHLVELLADYRQHYQ